MLTMVSSSEKAEKADPRRKWLGSWSFGRRSPRTFRPARDGRPELGPGSAPNSCALPSGRAMAVEVHSSVLVNSTRTETRPALASAPVTVLVQCGS